MWVRVKLNQLDICGFFLSSQATPTSCRRQPVGGTAATEEGQWSNSRLRTSKRTKRTRREWPGWRSRRRFTEFLSPDIFTLRSLCSWLSNLHSRSRISSSPRTPSQVRRAQDRGELPKPPRQVFFFCREELESTDRVENGLTRDSCLITPGTTWMQELVCLVLNRGDPQVSHTVPNWARAPWLEQHYFPSFLSSSVTPRVITTHLPFHLLGPALQDTKTKVKLLTNYEHQSCRGTAFLLLIGLV